MPKIKSEFEALEKELRQGMDARKTKRLERNATDWFLKKIRSSGSAVHKDRGKKNWDSKAERKEFSREDYMYGKQGIKSNPIAGQMFAYVYDAKHKDTLPYWDMFPMVMILNLYEDGWLGLNLHYLPPFLRARLLGLIKATMNSKKLSREAKARITYGMIKGMSKFAIAQPCIKRYLAGHVRSKIIRVLPAEWENAVMLPIDDFKKAPREKVWKDSITEIKKAGGKT